MALFEDESYDLNEEKNVENVYLIDEKKGLELVKKIFTKCNNISTEKFENIIFNKFFPLLAKLDIENDLQKQASVFIDNIVNQLEENKQKLEIMIKDKKANLIKFDKFISNITEAKKSLIELEG